MCTEKWRDVKPAFRAFGCEADTLLADVDVFAPRIPRVAATKLHACLRAFQNEHSKSKWGSLRIIRDLNLFLVESGLHIYLEHRAAPTDGYRLAADYCEHYDPRYGNCLNGPSSSRIREIIRFIDAVEAHEEQGAIAKPPTPPGKLIDCKPFDWLSTPELGRRDNS